MKRSLLHTYVLIRKFMTEPHSLRLMLDRATVNDCLFELIYDGFMNGITLWKTQLALVLYRTRPLITSSPT